MTRGLSLEPRELLSPRAGQPRSSGFRPSKEGIPEEGRVGRETSQLLCPLGVRNDSGYMLAYRVPSRIEPQLPTEVPATSLTQASQDHLPSKLPVPKSLSWDLPLGMGPKLQEQMTQSPGASVSPVKVVAISPLAGLSRSNDVS